MMPARKRCHSARDSLGMTGASEVRPCLRALWRTAALLSGVFGPRLPIGTRLGVTLNERQAPDVTLFEKLFWSFGVWDYGVILELAFFGRVAWRSATAASISLPFASMMARRSSGVRVSSTDLRVGLTALRS